MKIKGDWKTREVRIDNIMLDQRPSQKLWNHSPDGFNWGYGGSGPAQLALALMLHFTKDEREAQMLYQDFKWDVIAKLPQSDFELDSEVIERWILEHSAIGELKSE